ncbi:hypothetical protein AZH53_08265 [Methanomicrobiaceae archaeon CYW5]|uniref:hypothetical protein n=1 Tax=Methanovulcanius yangii TaxID=1789227 RepID=UPI0029CA8A06|nr:hypothetical protein [Methanovulcanius yangii]MBT8508396.1 hypothetical protein [Methanovulcanius yangii]
MKHILPLLLLLLCCIAATPAAGMNITSGNTIVINTTTDDDILSGANTLIINAPVKSVTWAGTTLIVNAPVETNIIAAGETVTLNAPVGADIMVAAGRLTTEDDIGGKAMIIADTTVFGGNATNVMVTASTVTLGPEAVISHDMMVSAESYDEQGTVLGTTSFDRQDPFDFTLFAAMMGFLFLVIRILCLIGIFLLGLVLIAVAGDHVRAAATPMSTPGGALLSFVTGLAGAIVAGLLLFLLALTVFGIPIAILLSCLLILALLAAVPVAAWCTGRWVMTLAGDEVPEKGTRPMYVPFTVGYVILTILFLLPWGIGIIIQCITVLTGFGAILQICYEEYNQRRDAKKGTETEGATAAGPTDTTTDTGTDTYEESKPAIDAELEREIEDAAEED